MKCKDCIHYTAHKHFYFGEEDFDEYFNDDNVESKCPEFEDKKEWLKLPCKVGDKAYWVDCQRYKNYTECCGYRYFGTLEREVIGNIHDNPELAEGLL